MASAEGLERLGSTRTIKVNVRIIAARHPAQRLGLKRTTLQNKIRRLQIARSDY